jgi:hypothetical protein
MVLNKDGSAQPAIVDMKSTQLKISRRWKTQIAMQKIPDKNGVMRTPALFATIWNLKTVEESNDMGIWLKIKIYLSMLRTLDLQLRVVLQRPFQKK